MAAALVLIGLGVAVLVQEVVGGRGEPSGAAGGGWTAERFGNSRRLASDGEHVCSTTPDQLLFCLDPATGDERFTRQLYDGVVTSPVVAAGHVLVAGSGSGSTGTLYALSLDGADRWTLPLDAPGDGRMAVVGDVVAAVTGDAVAGELVGIDAAAGTELWRAYSAADLSQPHVVSANAFTDGTRVYTSIVMVDPGAASGFAGHVVAVDPRSGDELWRSPPLPGVNRARGLAAVAGIDGGGAVAALLDGAPDLEGGAPGQLVVLDTATGEVRWAADVANLHAAVAHVDGRTVVVDGPEMRAYDGEGGELWAVPVPGRESGETGPTTLVPVGGRLLVAGRDLYAVDPDTGDAELVLESGTASDVAVAGDHVVVAGVFALTALPAGDVVAPA